MPLKQRQQERRWPACCSVAEAGRTSCCNTPIQKLSAGSNLLSSFCHLVSDHGHPFQCLPQLLPATRAAYLPAPWHCTSPSAELELGDSLYCRQPLPVRATAQWCEPFHCAPSSTGAWGNLCHPFCGGNKPVDMPHCGKSCPRLGT